MMVAKVCLEQIQQGTEEAKLETNMDSFFKEYCLEKKNEQQLEGEIR